MSRNHATPKRTPNAARSVSRMPARGSPVFRLGFAILFAQESATYPAKASISLTARPAGWSMRKSPAWRTWSRELGSLAAQGAGWQRPFVEQLSRLHLLARAVERFEHLPETARADVEAVLGVSIASDDLSPLPPVADRWQVIAQEVELEDRLRVQRTWLYGVRSQLRSVRLQFAHGTTAFEATISPGTQWDGELVFFPGNSLCSWCAMHPFKSRSSPRRWMCINGRTARSLQQSNADYPWPEQICLPLKSVVPTKIDNAVWLIDRTGAALPVDMKENASYTLLAISGGEPVDVAADFDSQSVRTLSVVSRARWMSLTASVAEAA